VSTTMRRVKQLSNTVTSKKIHLFGNNTIENRSDYWDRYHIRLLRKREGGGGLVDCYYRSGMFVMVHVWYCPALMAPVAVAFMLASVQSPAKEAIKPGGCASFTV
jgi:hypothetical protein